MKLLKMMVTMVMMLIISAQASTQESVSMVNSERAANAFLTHGVITQYAGDFSFGRLFDNGNRQYVHGYFQLNNNLEVSYLEVTVDKQPPVIVVDLKDEPLSGLPTNSLGIATKFNLNLYAYDKGWDFVAYGQMPEVEVLAPGDPLIIQLQPAWQNQFVAYEPPVDVSGSEIVLRFNGGTYFYDDYQHGFDVWYDPLTPNQRYEISNARTGERYQVGMITNPAPATESLISISLVGQVSDLFPEPTTDNVSYYHQEVTGMVERNGVLLPAKVYWARLGGRNLFLSTEPYLQLEIRLWTETGDGPLVATNVSSGQSWVSLPAGHDKVVITVLGDELQEFNLWASRY
ncbi:MAG: hypothetical protein HYV76_02470 [Candidatus Vogelbacteria bacterium]|nr:hypothetical protein [Candidatus Vogelbacteria bacterium]